VTPARASEKLNLLDKKTIPGAIYSSTVEQINLKRIIISKMQKIAHSTEDSLNVQKYNLEKLKVSY